MAGATERAAGPGGPGRAQEERVEVGGAGIGEVLAVRLFGLGMNGADVIGVPCGGPPVFGIQCRAGHERFEEGSARRQSSAKRENGQQVEPGDLRGVLPLGKIRTNRATQQRSNDVAATSAVEQRMKHSEQPAREIETVGTAVADQRIVDLARDRQEGRIADDVIEALSSYGIDEVARTKLDLRGQTVQHGVQPEEHLRLLLCFHRDQRPCGLRAQQTLRAHTRTEIETPAAAWKHEPGEADGIVAVIEVYGRVETLTEDPEVEMTDKPVLGEVQANRSQGAAQFRGHVPVEMLFGQVVPQDEDTSERGEMIRKIGEVAPQRRFSRLFGVGVVEGQDLGKVGRVEPVAEGGESGQVLSDQWIHRSELSTWMLPVRVRGWL